MKCADVIGPSAHCGLDVWREVWQWPRPSQQHETFGRTGIGLNFRYRSGHRTPPLAIMPGGRPKRQATIGPTSSRLGGIEEPLVAIGRRGGLHIGEVIGPHAIVLARPQAIGLVPAFIISIQVQQRARCVRGRARAWPDEHLTKDYNQHHTTNEHTTQTTIQVYRVPGSLYRVPRSLMYMYCSCICNGRSMAC